MRTMTWKKESINANVAGHIKPYSKTNMYLPINHPFGKPRPIKHYRRGRIHSDRLVKSSRSATVANLMDNPGAFIQNSNDKTTCTLIANYYPNLKNKTDTPDCSVDVTKMFNAENKARRRARSGPTIVKHNYYQRLQEYRAARCKTFDQKSFHFDEVTNDDGKIMGRCPNVIFNYDNNGKLIGQKESCTNVIYKPFNLQYATNNAVQSSTRTLNIKKETITRTSKTYKIDPETGQPVGNIFIEKNKEPSCAIHILKRHEQNKTACI